MNFKRLSTTLLLLAVPCIGQATSDGSTFACDAQEANLANPDPLLNPSTSCADGVSGVFGSEGNRNAVNNLSNDINSKKSDSNTAFYGESNLKGLAAGDHLNGWGFWGSFSYVNFEGDNNPEVAVNGGALAKLVYDADTKSATFGADRLFYDRLVLGVAVGYENTDTFTFFNGGNTESDGFSVIPYAAYLINDMFSIDVAFGYTSLEYDADRLQIGTGATLTGNYDSDRYFGSTNLNVSNTYNNWYLSGRVGYLYSHESQDSYTESGGVIIGERNVHISQIIVGGEASYNFGKQEPYFGVTYVNDLSRGIGRNTQNVGGMAATLAPDFDDDDEIQLNAGVRYYATNFTAILDLTHVVSRNNFDSTGVMFLLRSDL